MASRSKNFIDSIQENGEEITFFGVFIAIICLILYHALLVRVNPGEYYINDYSGEPVGNGLHWRDNVTHADTSIQFCAICCVKENPRKYMIDTYKKSSPYLHFRLKGMKVIATVVVTYNNTVDRYFPNDRSDDQFVADFMAVVQNLEREYSYDDVNRNREAFCQRIADDFNRTNTCGRIIHNIKLLDFKIYIAETKNDGEGDNSAQDCTDNTSQAQESSSDCVGSPDTENIPNIHGYASYCTEADSTLVNQKGIPDHPITTEQTIQTAYSPIPSDTAGKPEPH